MKLNLPIVLALPGGILANAATTVRNDLRRDDVPVVLNFNWEHEKQLLGATFPFQDFSDDAVALAKAEPTDWVALGAVTPAKDQGAHGYCGTFGRVAAAEGQFALRGAALRNFSEEELVDCIGWDEDQFAYFQPNGFMDSAVYPYNTTGPDMDPPIPYNPCRYDAAQVIAGTGGGRFTNATGAAPNEDQLVAFLHRNGPVQTGINADVCVVLSLPRKLAPLVAVNARCGGISFSSALAAGWNLVCKALSFASLLALSLLLPDLFPPERQVRPARGRLRGGRQLLHHRGDVQRPLDQGQEHRPLRDPRGLRHRRRARRLLAREELVVHRVRERRLH